MVEKLEASGELREGKYVAHPRREAAFYTREKTSIKCLLVSQSLVTGDKARISSSKHMEGLQMMKRKTGVVVALSVLTAVILGGAINPGPARQSLELSRENMRVVVEEEPFSIRVLDRHGKEMLSTSGPVEYTTVTDHEVSRFVLWWFWTPGLKRPWKIADTLVRVEKQGQSLVMDLAEKLDAPARVRIRALFHDDKTLRMETTVIAKPGINRVRMGFKKDDYDRYYGMGERFNAVEHSGSRVRNWSEEGGLGLFTLSKYVKDVPFNPFPKGPDTTYFPVPFFMNPAKNYGLLLDDVRYSEFDFGKTRKDRLFIENWNNRLDLMVFCGDSPLDIIECQTAYTGRIRVPPKWAFAPMAAVVAGEDKVLRTAKLLREEGIPTTAIWSESWWWRTEWEVNREMYPNYEDMIDKLHKDGFRHLGYYQPYISPGTSAYVEGDSKGYFMKNEEGETYDFYLGLTKKAQLDLTNPAARKWWKESFFQNSEDMGVDGWMHDFGEHTPPDSVAYDGRTGWELHNEYTVIWAELGREFWDGARLANDQCIYIRGGYTGSWKYAWIMWTGDMNANFDPVDGLPANIPALLSAGISGHPIGTTDIAGYNCFVNRSADRELFMRWTELGALLPVMRNHRGQDEVCDHWEFNRDRRTLDHYKKYAVLHTRLFPYIYTLAHRAAKSGRPVVRHLMLHYPHDPESRNTQYQYLLGDRILVAPVLERDAREWEVYLPPGEWAHWWTGKLYSGPARIKVSAELGELPMFVKSGKVLPLYDSPIDTLAEEDRPDIRGFGDADKSAEIIFYGNGFDGFELWDGTLIKCKRKEGIKGSCEVEGGVERKWSFEFR